MHIYQGLSVNVFGNIPGLALNLHDFQETAGKDHQPSLNNNTGCNKSEAVTFEQSFIIRWIVGMPYIGSLSKPSPLNPTYHDHQIDRTIHCFMLF